MTATFFFLVGAISLFGALTAIPGALHDHPREVTYYFISDLFFSLPALLCAWGVFKWRLWGHYLALYVSVVNLVVIGTALVAIRDRNLEIATACIAALVLCIMVWLLLPAVRKEYVRRTLAV
ncbi:MAG TPA: hypothetical protein VEJ46_09845 [Candidatus Acidoferrum sp.]|nr:hypothetical protein [Candidatus Acidoferrum sp.]